MKQPQWQGAFVRTKLTVLVAALLLSATPAAPRAAQSAGAKDLRPARKFALLVGISKYQRKGVPGEWGNLNTGLELKLLQEVLTEKFKFDPADIAVLRDEKATRAGILSALRDLAARAGKGDVVFFHYSGHGNSIPDDSGDEIDGMDEALVPFDYVSTKGLAKDYLSNNIRDDEIGKILDELKKKEPASVTVSLDSCYSGTATRGDLDTRGGGGAFVKPEGESPSGLQDKNTSYPRSYVFLAASRPWQTAKEVNYDDKQKIGVYSLALVKALNEATPRTTYRDLIERIRDVISSRWGGGNQDAQIEGSQDGLVFDGTAVRQERYVAVQPVATGKADDKAILRTGRLLGATAKSRYALYGPGTKDPNEKDAVKLAEGEIVETHATTSVIRLDRRVEAEKLKTARAFETEHYYEDPGMRVYLQDLRRLTSGEAVLAEFVGGATRGNPPSGLGFNLASFREVTTGESLRGEPYDVKVYPAGEREVKDGVVPEGFSGLVMERKDGSTLDTIPAGENLSERIKAALERENRFRVIRGLKDTEDPQLQIGLRLLPADVEFDSAGQAVKATPKGEAPRDAGGLPQFKLGDHFVLEVENRADIDLYVTILDLQPDGTIKAAFPDAETGVTENLIKRNSKVLIPLPYVFRVTPPLGEESFRAIATRDPTDFSPLVGASLIARARGGAIRGDDLISQLLGELRRQAVRGGPVNNAAQSPLGRILLASAIGTRAGRVASAPPSWATSSFTFVVKEK